MYQGVLFHCFSRVDAKAKFVLLAFALRYGVSEAVPANNARRADALGLSQQDLRYGLDQLVSEGYLVEEVPAGRQAGRPNRIFSISKQVVGLLSRSAERETAHGDLIRRVVEGPEVLAIRPSDDQAIPKPGERVVWINDKPVPKRRNRLSLPNRLLLAVLLAHADDFGIVRDLGGAELCRLAGLDAASLKQRVRKLISLGYIRRHIPGCASPLLSRKLKSIFVMNLNHPQLAGRNSQVLIHQSSVRPGSDIKYIRGMMGDVSAWRSGLRTVPTPVQVVIDFSREPLAVFSQLDFNLCCWASKLLIDQAAGQDGKAVVRSTICDFFRASTLRSRVRKGVPSDPVLDEQRAHSEWEDMVEYFLQLACQLADECRERFAMSDEACLDYRDLTLVPSHLSEGNRCMAFLVRMSASKVDQDSVVITEAEDGVWSMSYSRESDIDGSLLFECGLLERAASWPSNPTE